MDPLVSYHNTPFIDLNEDQPQDDDHLFHNLISPHISPSLTLSYQQQDQPQFFCREEQSFQLQSSLEVDHKIVSSGGSCDHLHHHPKVDQETESEYNDLKLRIWKSSSDNNSTLDGSVKWTSSKMRMMKKMIITNTDHNHHQDHNHDHDDQSNVDDHRLNHSPIMNFTSSTSSSSNIINNNTTNNAINTGMVIVRACSDCNTTKTPLWRSGPRGPKSLCNACGIRQRKARRAMAAAAANGTGVATVGDKKSAATTSKIQSKVKKSKIGANPGEDSFGNNPQFKKRSKPGRKKLACFEDILRISMKKSSAFHHVFPQDEKDAAILLMALSYGLVQG